MKQNILGFYSLWVYFKGKPSAGPKTSPSQTKISPEDLSKLSPQEKEKLLVSEFGLTEAELQASNIGFMRRSYREKLKKGNPLHVDARSFMKYAIKSQHASLRATAALLITNTSLLTSFIKNEIGKAKNGENNVTVLVCLATNEKTTYSSVTAILKEAIRTPIISHKELLLDFLGRTGRLKTNEVNMALSQTQTRDTIASFFSGKEFSFELKEEYLKPDKSLEYRLGVIEAKPPVKLLDKYCTDPIATIRVAIAEEAPHSVLLKMLKTENDHTVLTKIFESAALRTCPDAIYTRLLLKDKKTARLIYGNKYTPSNIKTMAEKLFAI